MACLSKRGIPGGSWQLCCWGARGAVAADAIPTAQLAVGWALSVGGVLLVGKRKLERAAAAAEEGEPRGPGPREPAAGGDAYPVSELSRVKGA